MPKQVVRRALVALAALTLMLAFAGVASASKYIVATRMCAPVER